MTIIGGLILFLILFVSSLYFDTLPTLRRKPWFIVLFVILVCTIGFRSIGGWIDTVGVYVPAFISKTNTLDSFSFDDKAFGYTERGFYFLSVLAKSIYDDPQFYLLFIGLLSMSFLFPFIWKSSPLPFLGVWIYTARFLLGRDMNQIRAGLAISMVMFFTYFLVKHKYIKYILAVGLAFYIHSSVVLTLPIILLEKIRPKRRTIYIGILLAFIVAILAGDTIQQMIAESSLAQEWASSYIDDKSDQSFASTLANPLIYFQVFLLFIFTNMERQLAVKFPYYYVLRNGYFYSTVLLIVLYKFAILAGRTSTILATFEIAIIPMIVFASQRYKWFWYSLFFVLLTFVFIRNWPGMNWGI